MSSVHLAYLMNRTREYVAQRCDVFALARSKLGLKFLGILVCVLLLGIGLSAFFVLSFEQEQFVENARESTMRVSQVVQASLEHAMLSEDSPMLSHMMQMVVGGAGLERIRILDMDGRVRIASSPSDLGLRYRLTDSLCRDCHRGDTAPTQGPISNFQISGNALLNSTLIPNRPECYSCHGASAHFLGFLIVETPLTNLNSQLSASFLRLASGGLITFALLAGILILSLGRLVVQPVVRLARCVREVGNGNLDCESRIERRSDEVGELAAAFDTMRQQLKDASAEKERRDRELEKVHLRSARSEATLQERERLARELHDLVSQALGFLKLKTAVIDDLLTKGLITQARVHVREVKEVAHDTYFDVREAIFGLHHLGSAQVEFVPALNRLLAVYRTHYGVPVYLVADENSAPSFSPEVTIQLTRIIQEALTNVRKHTRAQQVNVRLEQADDHWRIIVEDDGQGFNPERVPNSTQRSFGLQTMRERASSIGARFQVASSPDGGTRVAVCIPLVNEDENAGTFAYSAGR